jgi:hypothetical protein
MSCILFSEQQRFRQPFVWVNFMIVGGLWLYSVTTVLQQGQSLADQGFLMLVGCVLLALFLLFFKATLHTEIRSEGIYIRFFPFHRKPRFYAFADMSKIYVRQYRPLVEYGGWGLRGIGANRAYNVSGNQGLQIEFKNGHRLLIGSQQAEKLQSLLPQMEEMIKA